MRKILLVDDEPIFRMGLRTIVPWEELGCQIIGEAKNGVEALIQIEDKKPDIVFLDIKMPKLDGIQVLLKRKNYKENPKFVVLSCFNEYEYVREAMKLGACDYLFKPLMEEKDIKSVIQELLGREENRSTEDKNYEKCINECLVNTLRGNEKTEELINLCPDFFCNVYIFLAVKIPNRNYGSKKTEALLTLTKEVLIRCFDERRHPYFWEENYTLYGMFFLEEGDEYYRKTKRQNLWKQIREYVEVPVWVASSEPMTGPENMKMAFMQTRKALEAHFFSCYRGMGEEYLEYCKEMDLTYNLEDIYQKDLDLISEAFGMADREAIKTVLDKICDSILMQKRWNVKDFLHFLANIIISNMRRYRQQELMEQLIMEEYNVISSIYYQESMEEACEYFYQILEKIFEKIYIDVSKDPHSKEIHKIAEYMKAHYSEKITLQEMADRAHLSIKYFCKLFKRETGDTFVNYLTTIRVQAACEMLRNTDLKTYEIAEKTGFGNYNHFCKTVRKLTKKTPSEIRKS